MQLLNQNPSQNTTNIPITVNKESPVLEKEENNNILNEINNNLLKLLEKKQKHKKNTYLNITKSMFEQDILTVYPDFPSEKINMIYSDGNNYFVEVGKKKYPLNKKYFLKFINYILKSN
jgi:hypothetical protein